LHAAGPDAYPHGVEVLDARPRNAMTVLIGILLVWSVVSLTLPRTDVDAFAQDPVGVRIGPMIALVAIASDRPTARLDARQSEHPDAIPALLWAEAGTRSALLWLIGDVRFPASLIATSRLAADVVRRGPPLSFAT
jgi:hypothetical protein